MTRSRAALAALGASALVLAGCGGGETDDDSTPAAVSDAASPSTEAPAEADSDATSPAPAPDAAATTEDHDHEGEDDHEGEEGHDHEGEEGHDDHEAAAPSGGREAIEVAGAEPRLAVTYDGGVMVLDGLSLEVLGEFPAEGFVRVNPAGDTRHFLVTQNDGFHVLDSGTWSVPHGDHDHSYTTEPLLTDLVFEADHAGHVTPHHGTTALFADGTGEITLFASDELTDTELPATEVLRTPEAHHGVAVQLEDGTLVHSISEGEERVGATAGEVHGDHTHEIATSEECPGLHGETVAADEHVVMGCNDGALVYADGEFTKITAPDEYGRSGNLAGHDESPVVLGDYKTDPDAELERPEQVALFDTESDEVQLVDLGVGYSFRSLARGEEGEALILGTDGAIHVIDEESGEVEQEIPVVEEWEEPVEWQDPRPTIRVQGEFAYVTEPATDSLHIVDLAAGEVIDTTELPHTPNELSSVSG